MTGFFFIFIIIYYGRDTEIFLSSETKKLCGRLVSAYDLNVINIHSLVLIQIYILLYSREYLSNCQVFVWRIILTYFYCNMIGQYFPLNRFLTLEVFR